MSLRVAGQRCLSEREPELGLGIVDSVDEAGRRIAIRFPAAGESRLYALGTGVLKRVVFRAGDTITGRDGATLVVDGVEERDGLLTYADAAGRRLGEDEISDVTSVSLPDERLMAGQTDPVGVFDLRYRVLQAQSRIRQSEVRGFLGGRVQLIPHQFYILHEVSSRQIPRVLLADEVGLGKTIEACLILQRLLAVGKVARVLIVVPESLTHQWFVELLRRFNLWFSIYDEERCVAVAAGDPDGNPFLAAQFVLCSVGFLANDATRGEQAVAAGWDLVIVDEAHHLAWSPDAVSVEYTRVEQLSRVSPGLLLLTATPTQLGLAGHFARLRLLDPHRYADFDRFEKESEGYARVAAIAGKIVAERKLTAADQSALQRIFSRDPAGLAQHLEALEAGRPGAAEALLQTLLDQHGTGRVMFRNTRAAMTGFPSRQLCAVALPAGDDPALPGRIARELQAEETGGEAGIRYSFRDDPRIDWLAAFLKEHRGAKVLLICRSVRKVAAIDAALQERMKAKVALFHEALPLVQRDRNAAWFAEAGGAQLLICSEIGSEGRNFQFAHHLVLFDLPLAPGLIEQRIGRLDRIGQTETIRIHVPYVTGSAAEAVLAWYQRGVDAFERPLHGGDDFEQAFKSRVLAVAAAHGTGRAGRDDLEALIADTAGFRRELTERMKRGRDRLLELNSFNRSVAATVLERIRKADSDPALRRLLVELLDHFGVRIAEHEEGDMSFDPSHAYIESFPSIPADGMLATFTRARALVREDIVFLTADHPLVRDATDLLLESPAGTTAFGWLASDEPNLLLEAVFVLETVAEARWHVDQFLAPTPVRVVVDLRGRDQTGAHEAVRLAAALDDADLHRFLERPGFDAGVLRTMLASAADRAEDRSRALKESAGAAANAALTAEIQRLVDLRRVNDHIRLEEIGLAREQLEHTQAAISRARLRLDAIRLIVEGPAAT